MADGRRVYTRADLAARTGRGRSTLELWYRQRTSNGHPEAVARIGRALAWDAAAWESWYARRSSLAPVGGGRDPHEKVTLAEAARLLGMDPTSITMYPQRPPAGWPDPVEVEQLPSGRLRRWYTVAQIRDYAGRRHPGGGRPGGSPTARRWPYDGDERLALARHALLDTPAEEQAGLAARLAAAHGGTAGTWSHILTTARQHPGD